MKKRSLFVATAMLLVAVLVATGATYAWFTGVSNAKATVDMSVASGESLEISIDNGLTWYTNIKDALEGQWKDHSVADVNFKDSTATSPSFYNAVFEEDVNGQYTIKEYAASSPAKLDVMFKASKAGKVAMSGTIAYENASLDSLNDTLRLGAYNNTYKAIYAPIEDGSYAAAIKGTGLSDVDTQTYTKLTESATTNYVADLAAKDGDTYYYGSTTLYFWVEGPLCDNTMTNAQTTASAALTFALAQ